MLHLYSSKLPKALRRARQGGITLAETAMSVAILSLFIAFAYAAMMISNRQAMVHRLYTLAEEMARNQIDRIEAVGPFNPQFTAPMTAQIPAELVLDSTRSNLPLTSNNLPLYTDPDSSAVVVTATMTTSVTDTGTLNTRAALVTVTYTFAGRTYAVKMNTLRTSDS